MTAADKYHICTIIPKRSISYGAFRDIARLLKCSFDSLGIDCTSAINHMEKDRTNIIVGYQGLLGTEELLQYKYIIYQLEQFDNDQGLFSMTGTIRSNIESILKNAYEIWDYSENNGVLMKERLGVKAKILPMGYHPDMETVKQKRTKDIDVLFYGHMSPRRKYFKTSRQSDGMKSCFLFEVYDAKRDEMISRSGIVLNMHFYGNIPVFESARISYLLNNGAFVISEESADDPYKEIELLMVPFDELIETCRYYLGRKKEMEAIRISNYETFKSKYNMAEMLGRVLDE